MNTTETAQQAIDELVLWAKSARTASYGVLNDRLRDIIVNKEGLDKKESIFTEKGWKKVQKKLDALMEDAHEDLIEIAQLFELGIDEIIKKFNLDENIKSKISFNR